MCSLLLNDALWRTIRYMIESDFSMQLKYHLNKNCFHVEKNLNSRLFLTVSVYNV